MHSDPNTRQQPATSRNELTREPLFDNEITYIAGLQPLQVCEATNYR